MPNQPDSTLFERIRFSGQPEAHPESTVVHGNARFTVLTNRLIRMEWSQAGVFEDRSTYAFPTRLAPPVHFNVQMENNALTIRTEYLHLTWQAGAGPFSAENLQVSFKLNGQAQVWKPGMPNPRNLRGTRRTLDLTDRDASLAEGLLSRDGWVLFDDSRSVVFDSDGWVASRPKMDLQDWYFFAYGHDYKSALRDYSLFGGTIPLIPRFVLGAWWSRYWAYSDKDLRELVNAFEAHGLPLDVLVLDMDWHTPHAWTGYTWNRELFPDPEEFLEWVHSRGLRTTLNLHPAQGIQPFEEIYPEFAKQMGIDPNSKKPVPFRITDKKFIRHYFELLHHRMEDEGVDFWWLDWQQGDICELPGLDPLPWLNHLHFRDSSRRNRRPLIFSRWGGLGSHRYPIGFSGDTIVGWRALQFQPYFTATASNVLFGWWGHDIGGHMGRETEPELYARWVQYGALSPCLRLHATKHPDYERRPWAYPRPYFQAAKAAFALRYRLIPYIYSMARQAHDTALSLCRPLYYEHPEADDAYAARYNYYFGDQLIAAPIVFSADPTTGLASQDIWLPEGVWFDTETLEQHCGPCWIRLFGDINRLPLFAKAGAVIPEAPGFEDAQQPLLASGTTGTLNKDRLIVTAYPGGDGSFQLYEDDGESLGYLSGSFEWTELRSKMVDPSTWEVTIGAAAGSCPGLPENRSYQIRLAGCCPDRVELDGEEYNGWKYDSNAMLTVVNVPARSRRRPVRVTVFSKDGISALGEEHNRSLRRGDVARLLGWPAARLPDREEEIVETVLDLNSPAQTDAVARLGGPFARVMEYVTPEDASQQLGRVIVGLNREGDTYDLEVEFVLNRAGLQPVRHLQRFSGLTGSKIVDAPFAFDGTPHRMNWEARVKISWRGRTLTHHFRSSLLFPSIFNWSLLSYNPQDERIGVERLLTRDGRLDPSLPWKECKPAAASLVHLADPFGVVFSRELAGQLQRGIPSAAYLALGLESSQDREAHLVFQGDGKMSFYLNGNQVWAEALPSAGPDLPFQPHPYLQPPQRLSLRLKKGLNAFILHTEPEGQNFQDWYFGAALVTPDGDWTPFSI